MVSSWDSFEGGNSQLVFTWTGAIVTGCSYLQWRINFGWTENLFSYTCMYVCVYIYIYVYIYTHILFYIFCIMIYHSSLCYTVGPCCLSILYMLVCIGAVVLNHGHISFDTLPMKDGVCVLLKVSSLMTSLTNGIQWKWHCVCVCVCVS